MKNYEMKNRCIPLNDDFDVIVAGGGPSGCAAAIASAREGVKTLLIESTGALGGMGTSGLVPAWCPFSDKEKVIYSGLAEKILELTKTPAHIDKNSVDWQPIDPELLKRIYDDEVTDSGAKILFNTMVCGVEKKFENIIDTIILSNKTGLSAYHAKIFIDCTGDADLATWAGARTETGGEDGDLQPPTHCFILSNIDEYGYRYGDRLHADNKDCKIYDIINNDNYSLIKSPHLCNNLIGPGTVGFNAGHIWIGDNTNPFNISNGLIEGRKIAAEYKNALAQYYPAAFGNSFLIATASLLGIRESRRVIGDYILTLQDYEEKRSFDDEICRNSYFIDIHHNKSAEVKHENQDKSEIFAHYGKGESHGIPYRCLTPIGLDNILVAGRSISCERTVQGSVRVMPVCLCTGEAAGLAGALAVLSDNLNVHEIDTDKLRSRLKEEGAYLP